MTVKDIQKQLAELRQQLNYHSHRYYVLDDPELPDAEYDRLFGQLLKETDDVVAEISDHPSAEPR